jgi:pSer/pThr/pTyr-binding forkhead associated (FHA) protein
MDRDYVYPLKIGLNTIGRMPDNDIVLEDAYVSRRHCAILVHAGDFCELHDVASKNGTLLNGHKIHGPTRLKSGDEIRMCNRNLVFMSRAGEAPSNPPPMSQQTRTG